MMRTLARLIVVALAVLSLSADVILEPKAVAKMLADIGKYQQESHKAPNRAARLDALYQMGEEVIRLTGMMTNDLQLHGSNDPQMIARIMTRLKECGIAVKLQGEEYKYDMAAFREYLQQAPQGKRAADARFALLGFAEPGDRAVRLQKAIADKDRFIRDYPDYKAMPLVKYLLAQDHFHLAQVYEKSKDQAGKARQEEMARALLREIIKRYPGTEEAEAAARGLASISK